MKKSLFPQTILHEDDDYLIVNKPPFVSTFADRDTIDDDMLSRAKKYLPTAQACHRLDKGTSGVLLFAKHTIAYKHLCEQLTQQKVDKVYHAVLEGIHTWEDKRVEAPITVKSGNKAIIDVKQGKSAITHFKTLTHFWRHTLVVCQPLTGKIHQIRVHASHLKAPLVGDIPYGGQWLYLSQVKKSYKPTQEVERPLIQRVALHAIKLSFNGPQGKRIDIEAPYTKDFKALIRQLHLNT